MDNVIADIATTAASTASTADISGRTDIITTAILSTICGDDDGCYRRAAQRVVTTAAPTLGPGFSTTIPSHKMNCSEEEAMDRSCLNGGTCFAIKVGEYRQTACRCPDGWAGGICQYIEIPTFEVKQYQIRTAHLAAGVSVFILIAFAFLLALYVWHRLRKRDPSSNSEESHPLNEKAKIPSDTVVAHPETAAALNNTSCGGGGDSSVNGFNSTPVPKNPEEIHLTVMDETSDHNKQLGPSDTS